MKAFKDFVVVSMAVIIVIAAGVLITYKTETSVAEILPIETTTRDYSIKTDFNGINVQEVLEKWRKIKVTRGIFQVAVLFRNPDPDGEVERVRIFFGLIELPTEDTPAKYRIIEYDYFKDGVCWEFEIGDNNELISKEIPSNEIEGCMDCHQEEMRNQRNKRGI